MSNANNVVSHPSRNSAPKRLDSFQKFANDVFGELDEVDLLKHVLPTDRDQIKCDFARFVAEADKPRNLFILPLHMLTNSKDAKNVPGSFFAAQLKARHSGKIYVVGFDYGESLAKAA